MLPVLGQTLKHVSVRHVLELIPGYMPKQVPDRHMPEHVLARHMLGHLLGLKKNPEK